MIQLDVRGMLCPKPIIETKKAINSLTEKSQIEILIEDDIATCNVTQYLTELGIKFLQSKGKIIFEAEPIHQNNKEVNCNIRTTSLQSYAVVVNSLSMGDGDEALGKILLKAFFSTLEQSSVLPSHLVFYNAGVRCCTSEVGVLDSIKDLERQGVAIVVCGTCVDFYDIKDNLEVGIIGNMYKIVEILQSVSKVVNP